jgi:flavodoxin
VHSVVVYDSQFGNTEAVAHVVAKALGEFGPARAAHVTETAVTQLRNVDLLVFGCPTQGLKGSPTLRLFFERLPLEVLRGSKVACFDTRMRAPRWIGRSPASDLARRLKRLHVELVVPPEGFYLNDREGPLQAGEVERAAEWARSIGQQATSR